ncbi:hypothetical protein RclHR1_04580014 [Rhizophagus clarus]|uniref:Phosphatidylglycerol/phosphatidylinositol transfer protein n=1 Tax=Rhizophagus clarus TaxID=94130 RepID=A0A2Z6RIC7_9GLOM|nr:hypothetical protein RclHR1_04580014 [Rhizophagus clarus]GES77768.1 S-adenosyl-L-methionine-dependent methyltransferase [Rhizophagus clarus]
MGKTNSKLTTDDDNHILNEREKYNLHLRHHLTREIFKGNFSSPVHNILTGWSARVLHVNSVLGTWLAEMSANYPGCTYIGVNPLSSDEDGKPFDVEFIESDIQREGLPYDDDRFDFIVIRFCGWEYSESEWKDIIKELIRCLKPGGWVEFTDGDMKNFQNPGPNLISLLNNLKHIKPKKDSSMNMINKYEEILTESNEVENVQRQTEYLPIGEHGEKLGETALQYFHDMINMNLPRYVKLLGIQPKDVPYIADTICEEANKNNTTQFQVCDSGASYPLSITTLTYNPNPIVPGQNLTLDLEGEAQKQVEQNSILKIQGIVIVPIFTDNVDFCNEVLSPNVPSGSQLCPIPVGNFKYAVSVVVPNRPELSSVNGITVRFTLLNPDNTELTCIEGPIQIASANS